MQVKVSTEFKLSSAMISRKFLVLFSTFLCLCVLSFSDKTVVRKGEKEFQNVHIKSVQCNISEKYVYNCTCFAKSYSRTISTMTAFATTRIPLYELYVR